MGLGVGGWREEVKLNSSDDASKTGLVQTPAKTPGPSSWIWGQNHQTVVKNDTSHHAYWVEAAHGGLLLETWPCRDAASIVSSLGGPGVTLPTYSSSYRAAVCSFPATWSVCLACLPVWMGTYLKLRKLPLSALDEPVNSSGCPAEWLRARAFLFCPLQLDVE